MQKSKINSLTKGKILPYSAGSLAGAGVILLAPGFPRSIPVPGGWYSDGISDGTRGNGDQGSGACRSCDLSQKGNFDG